MPVAILTKALPATAKRPRRIRAWTGDGGYSHISPWPECVDRDVSAFWAAALAMLKQHGLGWDVQEMTYGATEGGYVFTFAASKLTPELVYRVGRERTLSVTF